MLPIYFGLVSCLVAVKMKVFELLLCFGALVQGALAQQEFLARLPSCAVGLLTGIFSGYS